LVLLLATLAITSAIGAVMVPEGGVTAKYAVGFAFVLLAEFLAFSGPLLTAALSERARRPLAFFLQQGYVVGIYVTLVAGISGVALATPISGEWLLTTHLVALGLCLILGGISHNVGDHAERAALDRVVLRAALEEIRAAFDLAMAQAARLPANVQAALRPGLYEVQQQLRFAASDSRLESEGQETKLREGVALLQEQLRALDGDTRAPEVLLEELRPLLLELSATLAEREAILKHSP
jgi:hypothetical protein